MTTENIREYIALLDSQIESAERLREIVQSYCKHGDKKKVKFYDRCTDGYETTTRCKICGLETA